VVWFLVSWLSGHYDYDCDYRCGCVCESFGKQGRELGLNEICLVLVVTFLFFFTDGLGVGYLHV
jgi:hypothetical protein